MRRIVEQKDATADEAAVGEINVGVYVFRAAPLREQLALVGRRTRRARSTSPT